MNGLLLQAFFRCYIGGTTEGTSLPERVSQMRRRATCATKGKDGTDSGVGGKGMKPVVTAPLSRFPLGRRGLDYRSWALTA